MVSQKKPQKRGTGSSFRKRVVRSLPFLLEIGTEEIPTKFLSQALHDLEVVGKQLLTDCRLSYHQIRAVGTSRRLTLLIDGVQVQQSSLTQEVVGPPKSAAFDASGEPTKAALGFAKSQGVLVSQLSVKDTPKGLYLVAQKHERGQFAKQTLSSCLPGYLAKLTFSKTMRWNATQTKFVRPVRWCVVLFGDQVMRIEFAGIRSNRVTFGHRTFKVRGKRTPQGIPLTNPVSYVADLKKLGVLVDPDERRAEITQQISALAKIARGQIDPEHREELIDEAVWGTEYPHAILGTFSKEFLALPKAVLISSMKEHQGFLSLVGKDGKLLPKFVAVTNSPWGNTALITRGNERVLSARLKDAQYFFQEDMKRPFHTRVSALDGVMFHHKLGTMRQKVERIQNLAGWIVAALGRDNLKEVCQRAGLLSKADLTTGMVGEFPNLQGMMGEEYARHDGENQEVWRAIGEQYFPRFPDDQLPESFPGRVVACADRCDSIAAFFAIGMAPTGSEDPLGLRRAAYGLVRIISESSMQLNLVQVFDGILQILVEQGVGKSRPETITQIMNFMIDRLRFYGHNTLGLREDVMEAVTRVRLENAGDLGDLLSRMKALQDIVGQQDFDTLLLGFKRAHRIVEKEAWHLTNIIPEQLQHETEIRLFQLFDEAKQEIRDCLTTQGYGKALRILLRFTSPIDEFFAAVLINDPVPHIRENRLSLLKGIDQLFLSIADFSYLQSPGTEVG